MFGFGTAKMGAAENGSLRGDSMFLTLAIILAVISLICTCSVVVLQPFDHKRFICQPKRRTVAACYLCVA